MKTFITVVIVNLFMLIAISSVCRCEGIAVVVDRDREGERMTSVCIVTPEGEEGPCFMKDIFPSEYVWEGISYHQSGKFLIAEKQSPKELWMFTIDGGQKMIAASENGFGAVAFAGSEPVVFYYILDADYKLHLYSMRIPDDLDAEPEISECPGNFPEGLMVDTKNRRILYFTLSEQTSAQILVSCDLECKNQTAEIALPKDVTVNTNSAVLSPDGNLVMYHGFYGGNLPVGLFLTDIAAKESRDVIINHRAALGEGQPDRYSFSPDMTNIAFTFFGKDGNYEFYMVSSDGKTLHKAQSDEIETFRSTTPKWHPSGKWATVAAVLKNRDESDVYSFSTEGELKNLTSGQGGHKWGQAISPSGRYLAYISGDNQALMLFDCENMKGVGAFQVPGYYAYPVWIAYDQ
ncbi:MAG: hypothetical protein AB1546_06435 [bacterium]